MRVTRRGLLISASGALAASAAGPAFAQVTGPSDAFLLADAVREEQVTVAVYSAVLGAGVVHGHGARLLERILSHERAHLAAFTTAYEQFGLHPPAGPADAAAIDLALGALGVSRRLSGALDSRAALALLLELEEVVLRLHARAQRGYAAARLIQMTGSIVAAEGTHLVALRHAAPGHRLLPMARELP